MKDKINVIIWFLFIIFPCFLFSGNKFARTYGMRNRDYALSIQQTTDGGYILGGYTDSFGAGDADILILKINPQGGLEWVKTFGGSNYEEAFSIHETNDGGYIVAGPTYSFGAGSSDFSVLKLNFQGNLEWAKTFGGNDLDFPLSIQQTTDGGYILAGYTASFGAGNYDILVLKLDFQGNLEWVKTFGGNYDEAVWKIQQVSDGGYILAGYTYSFNANNADILVLKLNFQGNLEWVKTFGGNYDDIARSIQQVSDGGYILAGYTASFGAGNYDILVLKLDPQGNLEWVKTFGGNYEDIACDIQHTSDGGYILAGSGWLSCAISYDFLVLKLNIQGDIEWIRTFGGSNEDKAVSVQQTSDGGYIIGGLTWSFGAGSSDFLVLKFSSDGSYPGCINSCIPIVNSLNDTVKPFALNTTSPSPAIQSIIPITLSPSILIFDICDPIEVSEFPFPSEKSFSYPILFFEAYYSIPSNSIIIKYTMERESKISLDLYNLSGNFIKNIYKGLQKEGDYKFEIGTKEEITQGIYFIKLKADKSIFTRKITILK